MGCRHAIPVPPVGFLLGWDHLIEGSTLCFSSCFGSLYDRVHYERASERLVLYCVGTQVGGYIPTISVGGFGIGLQPPSPILTV